MSSFRPAARVTGPDGREWEIYAYKLRASNREGSRVTGVTWLLTAIPRALLRLYDVGVAAARSLRSEEWTVEAVTWMPAETRYAWTTTTEHKGQVVAQVEGSLAHGHVPLRLRNAVYRGESRSAR